MLDILNTAEGCCVRFTGDFTIFEAGEMFETLKTVLLENQDVSFDLSKILNIDTSVMQSLMFAKCLLKQHSRDLHLINHSQPVLDLMERLGLINWFNDPLVMPSDKSTARRSGSKA